VLQRKEHHLFAYGAVVFVGTGCGIAGAAGGCGRLCKTLHTACRRCSAFHTADHNHLENSPPLPPPVFLSPLENRPLRPTLANRSRVPVSHNSTAPTTTTISFSLFANRGLILYRGTFQGDRGVGVYEPAGRNQNSLFSWNRPLPHLNS